MDRNELQKLLEKNEDEHIEFKEAKSSYDFDKILEYSIALANEKGGKLVFGVTDKKPRVICGTQIYKDDLAKIKEQLITQTHLRIDIEEVLCPEGRVLIFSIPSRPIGMPMHIKGRYLMRAGEALTAMPPDMLKRIFDESGPDFSAEVCIQAVFSDLDSDAIEDFRNRWIQKTGNKALQSLSKEQLLTDAELTMKNKITYAGRWYVGPEKADCNHG